MRSWLYQETRNYFVVCLKNGADAGIFFYFISRLTQRRQRLLHRIHPETRITGANGPLAYWCRGRKLNIYYVYFISFQYLALRCREPTHALPIYSAGRSSRASPHPWKAPAPVRLPRSRAGGSHNPRITPPQDPRNGAWWKEGASRERCWQCHSPFSPCKGVCGFQPHPSCRAVISFKKEKIPLIRQRKGLPSVLHFPPSPKNLSL